MVIYILWLRQLKRYFRSKSRIIGSIGQPVLFLLALGFGFGPIYSKAGGGDYMQFLAPGVIAMGILFTAMFAGIEIIWDRQFGFLKETLVAPVSRFEIMLGRTLGGATTALLQGIIVFVITLFVGFHPNFAFLPVAFFFMVFIALLFTALGTGIASLLNDMQAFPLIMNFLIMPTFFLSGALFPLKGLPVGITAVTRFNPLTYGVDGLRHALTGLAQYSFTMDAVVLVFVTALFVWICSYLFSKIEV